MFDAIRRKFEISNALKWGAVFAVMVFMNNAGARREPFSAAIYMAILMCGGGVFASSLVYAASFIFSLTFDLGFSILAQIAVLCAIYATFGKKYKLGFKALPLLPVSFLPYVFLYGKGETVCFIAVAVITVLAAVVFPGVKAVKVKGLMSPDALETLSFCTVFILAGMGGVKYSGADIYRAVCVIILAFAAMTTGGREACFFSFILSVPVAAVYKDPSAAVPFLFFGVVSFAFAKGNRILYEAALLFSELVSAYVLGLYGQYGYIDLLYFAGALLIVALIPQKACDGLSSMLAASNEKPISRYEINRTRTLISSRLYEISGTFNEIAVLFRSLSKRDDPFVYETAAIKDISEMCDGCSKRANCRSIGFPSREELTRIIEIGKGKGRLSAADLPGAFSDKCHRTGKIVHIINGYVQSYGAEMEKLRAAEEVRTLVAIQAEGVSAALKSMAKNMAKSLSFQRGREEKLRAFLLKRGVGAQEVMIYGEGENTEIRIVLPVGADGSALEKINEFFRAKFTVTDKFDLGRGKVIYSLERTRRNDCVFGVATVKKEGNADSGDTHSLTKLSHSRFLLALSDGMGSGKRARATSEATLSLLECFYRAGLPGEVALSSVNRLLAFVGEDNFAALDLAVINLEKLTCDFVKLGAPYGFILSRGEVKLIEGSSLPVGILSEVKPSVCTETILPGDIVLFASDGVTDAFGSSTDFSDYLAAEPSLNPQKLADAVLGKALKFYGGKAQDDMTVVACKIFTS